MREGLLRPLVMRVTPALPTSRPVRLAPGIFRIPTPPESQSVDLNEVSAYRARRFSPEGMPSAILGTRVEHLRRSNETARLATHMP